MDEMPITPGQILDRKFLGRWELTQKQLAAHIGVDVKVINRIVNDRASISPVVAVKLAYAFDTSPQFWLEAQNALDLYHAKQRIGVLPQPLPKAQEEEWE